DQRYAAAADLAADLDQFLVGKPVAASPYHFRLDESEIVAARPGRVVLAAFIFFVLSFFVFFSAASLGLFFGIMTCGLDPDYGTRLMALTIPVAVLAVGLTIGRGILSGRAWARWLGIAAASVIILTVAGMTAVGVRAFIIISGTDRERFERAAE